MDNMRYYNAGREVPDAAKRTIKGGRQNEIQSGRKERACILYQMQTEAEG